MLTIFLIPIQVHRFFSCHGSIWCYLQEILYLCSCRECIQLCPGYWGSLCHLDTTDYQIALTFYYTTLFTLYTFHFKHTSWTNISLHTYRSLLSHPYSYLLSSHTYSDSCKCIYSMLCFSHSLSSNT